MPLMLIGPCLARRRWLTAPINFQEADGHRSGSRSDRWVGWDRRSLTAQYRSHTWIKRPPESRHSRLSPNRLVANESVIREHESQLTKSLWYGRSRRMGKQG